VTRTRLETLVQKVFWAAVKLAATLLALCVIYGVWVVECRLPSDDARRVIEPLVRWRLQREPADIRHPYSIDAELRTLYPNLPNLTQYRIVVRPAPGTPEIVIRPTGFWCLCRKTVVLHDDAKRVKVDLPSRLRR
jgi:hypothetical protein